MVQIENISKNALCAGEKSPAVMQPFTLQVTPAIGFFDTANPVLIYRVRNKNRGNQQSNLFSVSATNVLRVTNSDLIHFMCRNSGEKARYDKSQKGCFRSISQTL